MFLLNSRRNKVEFSLCILISIINVLDEIIILTLYEKHTTCFFLSLVDLLIILGIFSEGVAIMTDILGHIKPNQLW